MSDIAYNEIKMLFLDVGNTLMSIDFEWVCKELKELGIQCDAGTLQRAEAAARPELSAQVNEMKKIPGMDMRVFYFVKMLEKLPQEMTQNVRLKEIVVQGLVPVLFSEGNAFRLWSHVMPGTHEALQKFQAMGLPMHVISNSDGTVETQLISKDLRSFFGQVIDSHIVNVEKPSPKIFEMALEMTHCKPQEALFVGDIYDVDIVGAESVGMKAVLLDPYSDWDGVACERVPDLPALADRLESTRG